MADELVQVPADLPVTGTPAPETSEPLAQPDQSAPSTGTEQPTEIPDAAAEPSEKETGEPTEQQSEEPAKKVPWFVERDKRRQATIAELNRRIEELSARPAAQPGGEEQPNQPQQPKPFTQAEFDRLVAQRAEQVAELKAFDAKGEKEVPKFTEKCNIIASLGGAENPHFMPAITALDDGHKVIAHLADHPEEAMKILDMPPIRMAVALAKLSGKAPKPPSVSTAPKPVKPITAGGTIVEPDESRLSDEEWFQRRQESNRKR